jgi:drug/metabolite transporter (DMT)-like permease
VSIENRKLVPVFQALLVTFLWSTSFIIIKIGLVEIPPLTFAGLRYFLAFICFIPFIMKKKYTDEIKNINKKDLLKILLLGVVFYTFTQGTQFIGLSLLEPVTVSMMLNFSPLAVALLGFVFLKEKPTKYQLLGLFLFILGIVIYFYPISTMGNRKLGLIVMSIAVLSNAFSSILGRNINKKKNLDPVVITFISMGIGSVILLMIGIITDGFIDISIKNWLALFWLAFVNTAFAFTLWNTSLRTLSAMESSIINGTMLIQIAILAWIFLGDTITIEKGIGMFIAGTGAIIVQLKKGSKN